MQAIIGIALLALFIGLLGSLCGVALGISPIHSGISGAFVVVLFAAWRTSNESLWSE